MANEDNKLLNALESIAGGEAVPDKELPNPTVDATRLFRRQDMIKARSLMNKHAGDRLEMGKAIREQVVEPLMKHINEYTKQENDSRYWSYVVMYLLERDPRIGTYPTSDWAWGTRG